MLPENNSKGTQKDKNEEDIDLSQYLNEDWPDLSKYK